MYIERFTTTRCYDVRCALVVCCRLCCRDDKTEEKNYVSKKKK